MQSNTLWMLMAEFQSPVVNLSDCLHHLDFATVEEANRAASSGKLPVPTFRSRESTRARRKVHLTDLAEMIDQKREKALNSWNAENDTAQKPTAQAKRKKRNAA